MIFTIKRIWWWAGPLLLVATIAASLLAQPLPASAGLARLNPVPTVTAAPTISPASASNPNTWKLISEFGIGAVQDVFWSTDSERLAFVGQSGVWVYGLQSQGSARRVINSTAYTLTHVRAAALSEDWRILAVADTNATLEIWDTRAQTLKVTYHDQA